MKILAVGDIHTKIWIIKNAEKIIDDYDHIVFVGDYADDWGATPHASIDTWLELKALQDKYPDKVNLVAGNHDYIYVNYTKSLQSGYNPFIETLLNTQQKDLATWLKNLPIIIELDGVSFSHAGITKHWDGEQTSTSLWRNNSPLWARPFNQEYKDIPQVFGHTPSETCWEVKPNVWCIDTFSTMSDGTPIGDYTVLEIVDGKHFKKVQFKH